LGQAFHTSLFAHPLPSFARKAHSLSPVDAFGGVPILSAKNFGLCCEQSEANLPTHVIASVAKQSSVQVYALKIRPVKARFAQGLDSAVFRVCIKP